MKIWVDADACPKAVRDILIRTAKRLSVKVTFVSNQFHQIPTSEYIETIQVAGGFDIADEYIIGKTERKNLIITADIPLAAAVIAKDAYILSPRGRFLNSENIQEALIMRNLKEELRSSGIDTGGQKPFSNKDRENFANQLDKFIRNYWQS